MKCNILATKTNKADSILGAQLYNIVNDENKATNLYSHFITPEFMEEFGNYENVYNIKTKTTLTDKEKLYTLTPEYKSISERTDENGEPSLYYNEVLNKYFYRDIYNEPVFYPHNLQGLNSEMTINDIKIVAEMIAMSFYKNNVKFNYEKLQFDLKKGVNIKKYIKEFIDSKINELSNSSDFNHILLSGALKNTKDSVDEWYNEVNDYFRTLNTEYNINDENSINEAETSKGDLMRIESFFKSSKDSINNNIKLYLSLLEHKILNKDGKLEVVLNDFNEPEYLPFDDVYSTLNKRLSDQTYIIENNEDIFDVYLNEIKLITSSKPEFAALHAKLVNSNVTNDFKNQFVSAFNLFRKNYLTSEYSKNSSSYTIMNVSDVTNRKQNILEKWFYNFNKLTNKEPGKIKRVNQEALKEAKNYTNRLKKITTEADLVNELNKLKEVFESLGITYTQKGFDYFLNEKSNIPLTVDETKKRITKIYNAITFSLKYQNENPKKNLFLNQDLFKEMADAEAFFQKDGTDASLFTMGKMKWVYSLPSYLDLKIAQWKKDPSLLIKHYESSIFNKGSHWMRYLSAADILDPIKRLEKSKENLAMIEVGIFNSLQHEGDSMNGVDLHNISSTDLFVDYIHKLLNFKKGGKTFHKTALAAGKSTEYQIFYGHDVDYFNISTNVTLIDGGITVTNAKVLDIFYKYFKSEYDRINFEYDFIQANKEEDLLPNYHLGNKNALKSQLFPKLSNNDIIRLYDDNGKPLYSDLDQMKDKVIQHISNSLSESIRNTYDRMLEEGVFEFNNEGNVVNKVLDKDIYNYYHNSKGITAFHHVAADTFINNIISQVEYSKMFSGDVAYYKDIADYKKRVPATYTDGMYMRITDKKDTYFNASIISGVEIGYQHISDLPEKVQEFYKEAINTTDAQAWITPQRWEFIMKGLGKWNSTYESAYRKMKKPGKPKYTSQELKVMAQPLKGVYFDVVNGKPVYLKYSQAVLVPNLIKGSKLEVFYNKMVPVDSKYEDQIHELITKDGVKVGYKNPVTTHNEDGSVKKGNEFTLNKMQLSNYNWKLQQDLPVKGIKATEVGSQIQKNIFQALTRLLNNPDNTVKFFMGEESFSADEIANTIHETTLALSNLGVQEVKDELGLDENFKITDDSKLYNSIINQLKTRSGTSDNIIKALQAGISPYGIAGAFNTFQNAFSSLLNKKTVKIKTNGGSFIQMSDYGLSKEDANKQNVIYTPWFDETSDKLKMPTPYIDKDGNKKWKPGGIFISGTILSKYLPNYKDYKAEDLFGSKESNYTDGILDKRILENIIGYRIPNQGLASNDALTVMGILPEETGDTVIAYTGITTKTGSDFDIDKMFLMIPSIDIKYKNELKLERYITNALKGKTNEDTIANIESIINQIGDDSININVNELAALMFDKDDVNNLKYSTNSLIKIITDFEGEHPLVDYIKEQATKIEVDKLQYVEFDKSLPYSQQSKKALQNRLIETYKSILTSDIAMEDILKPIDLKFMSKDIINMFPQMEEDDFSSFNAFNDIDLKIEFMLGKAGLGQNVNSLVDAVRGAMADLKFNKYYLGWGEPNKDDETYFDKEYSEALTTAEIKDYISLYNQSAVKNNAPELTDKEIKDIYDNKSIKLNESMMTLVNGFVDIEKDAYIVRGNWVTQTNNVGFMLLRAGVHPFKVNAFLGQPILKDYVKFRNNKESITLNDSTSIETNFKISMLSKSVKDKFKKESLTINNKSVEYNTIFKVLFTKDKINKLINSVDEYSETPYEDPKYLSIKKELIKSITYPLKKKFGVEGDKGLYNTNSAIKDKIDSELNDVILPMFNEIFEPELVDISKLTLKTLKGEIINGESISIQLSVLKKYNEWQTQAKKLAKNVKASKVDVEGKYKDIVSAFMAENMIKNLLANDKIQDELSGFSSKFKVNDKATILKIAIDNGLGFSNKIMQANPKFFITHGKDVKNSFNSVSNFVYGENLVNEKLGSKLQNAYYSYLMSGFKPLQVSKDEKNNLINNLHKRLDVLQRTVKNPLLQELIIQDNDKDGVAISTILMPNIKKSVAFKNSLTNGWNQLLETHPEFAEDLIKYSYIITGFNNSINQFHEYIPYQWFNKNRFNSYLKSVRLDKGIVDRNFINQFFRHNLEDNTLSKQVNENALTLIKGQKNKKSIVAYDKKKLAKFPYILRVPSYNELNEITGNIYYEFNGENSFGEGIYTRANGIGFNNRKNVKFFEYDINHIYSPSNSKRSTFSSNVINDQLDNEAINKAKNEYTVDNNINHRVDNVELYENLNYMEQYDRDETASISDPLNTLEDSKQQTSEIEESNVTSLTQEVRNVAEGVKIINNALSLSEETEIFDMLKPFLEEQGSKSNKGKSAPIMIGLNLRWDYKSNNPGKTAISIKETINNSTYQKNKYGYYDVSIDGNALGPIPDRLKELMTKATGIDASNYDGAIINLYKKNSFISAHNDVDESITAIGYPVLVVNIGGEGSLSIEGSESQRAKKGYASKEYTNEFLESGSAYIFGNDGKNRDVFHRTIPSKGTGTLPSLTVKGETIPANSYRISVTLRRVEDLESGMPLTPNKIENSTQQTSEVKKEVKAKTVQEIYNDYIKGKENEDNTVSIQYIELIVEELGIEEAAEYIKNCYK